MDFLLGRLLYLPGILLGISVHECSHGYAAVRMGDDTPLMQGRITLNPLRHLDPIGFLCLLVFGFGWANPVQINPRNFRNPRRDDALVSLAGPVSNFLVAFLFMGLMKLADMYLPYTLPNQIVFEVLRSTVYINLVLMAFNLIPIPPLDGHHILGSIGGAKVWNFYYKYREQLRFALLLLIVFRGIGRIIGPVINAIYRFLFSIFF